MASTKWWLTSVFTLVLLAGCNGSAPLLTCRDACSPSYLTRDLFCVCQDYRDVQFPGTPQVADGKPDFDWKWEEALGCPLNRHVYLINYSRKKLIVDVSWRVPGSIDRKHKEYTIAGNVTNYKDGFDLGYEEYPVSNSSLCFDKDFMVSGVREPHHLSTEEYAKAQLAENAPRMQLQHDLMLAKLQAIHVAEVGSSTSALNTLNMGTAKIQLHSNSEPQITTTKHIAVDCRQICDSNDTLRCPIRGYPPDQNKLKTVRDRLRASVDKPEYSAADIYTVFGVTKDSCVRSDIKIANNKLFNVGQYCAFPTFLKDSDPEPALSLHFPESIRGQRVVTKETSGMAFNAGVSQPTLYFSDAERHGNYGGVVQEAVASDKGLYYQTTNTCIFLGLR